MRYETKILKVKGDWKEVLDDCRLTVGKKFLNKEPTKLFKRKILIAEHSPIRDITIKWIWRGIYSFVATHWSRHKWECKIRTQRSDRVGEDTNGNGRTTPVEFIGDANPQHLIDSFRKRLCYQASSETRDTAEDFKEKLHPMEEEISDVLVPNCVYRCGCPEMEKCPFGDASLWATLLKWACDTHGVDIRKLSIEGRYRMYNEWFYTEHRK